MKLKAIVSLVILNLLADSTSAHRLSTLPDVRSNLTTEDEIKAHETARSAAAKVKKNPQQTLLDAIKADLE